LLLCFFETISILQVARRFHSVERSNPSRMPKWHNLPYHRLDSGGNCSSHVPLFRHNRYENLKSNCPG
jgi:hypothetical protein